MHKTHAMGKMIVRVTGLFAHGQFARGKFAHGQFVQRTIRP